MNYDKYHTKLINVFTAVKCAVENDDRVSLRSFIKTFGVDPGHTITLLKQHELLQCTGAGMGAHWKWTGTGKATIEEVARKIVEQKKAADQVSVERLAHYRFQASKRTTTEKHTDEELLVVFNKLQGRARQQFFRENTEALIRAMNHSETHSLQAPAVQSLLDKELNRHRSAINTLVNRMDQADRELRCLASAIGLLRESLKLGDRSVPSRLAKVERYVGWLQKNLGDDSATSSSTSAPVSSAPSVDTPPPINDPMRISA